MILTQEYPELLDKEWLAEHYGKLGMTADEIAEELGFEVTAASVIYYLEKAGIRRRKPSRRRDSEKVRTNRYG